MAEQFIHIRYINLHGILRHGHEPVHESNAMKNVGNIFIIIFYNIFVGPLNDNSHNEQNIKWTDVLILDKYKIWKWDSVLIVVGIFIISEGWGLLSIGTTSFGTPVGSPFWQIMGVIMLTFGLVIIGVSSERVYKRYLKLRRRE